MRRMQTWVVVVGLGFLVLGGVGARAGGDEPGEGPPPDLGARILATALDLMQARIEAQIGVADSLRALGRHEEALAAYREVHAIYRQMQGEIHVLLARIEASPGAGRPRLVPPPVPVAPPPPVAAPPAPPGPPPAPVVSLPSLAGDDGLPAGRPFPGRGADRGAASKEERSAVVDALRWLAAHQSPNGSWEASGFERWCDGKPDPTPDLLDGQGRAGVYDVGVTGLALCAFLGAGYTQRGQHPFSPVVSKGLRYLLAVQDAEGCFGPRTTQHYVYNHAIASLAVVEAYGMTGSTLLKTPAQKALDFVALSRNPYFAWRYGVKPGDNDTSVTGWMAMVLKSAQVVNHAAVAQGAPAPLAVDEASLDGAKAWIDKMTDPDHGRVGYIQRGGLPARPQQMSDRFPGDKSESMTAVGILCRILLGEDPARSEPIGKGAELLRRRPPVWNPTDGSIDMYYWYYGTLAAFQVGGDVWRTWHVALKPAILDTQRVDGDACGYRGSWDPLDPWGPDGGRVYSTALMALCLEVYDRYDRAFGATE